MDILERAREYVVMTKPRVLLPELEDPRVAQAAKELERLGCKIIVPDMTKPADDFIHPFLAQKPSLSVQVAQEYALEPTHRAAAMLAMGEGDLMVSGAVSETATVLRAGLRAVGLSKNALLVCSSFLIVFPEGRQFLFPGV